MSSRDPHPRNLCVSLPTALALDQLQSGRSARTRHRDSCCPVHSTASTPPVGSAVCDSSRCPVRCRQHLARSWPLSPGPPVQGPAGPLESILRRPPLRPVQRCGPDVSAGVQPQARLGTASADQAADRGPPGSLPHRLSVSSVGKRGWGWRMLGLVAPPSLQPDGLASLQHHVRPTGECVSSCGTGHNPQDHVVN